MVYFEITQQLYVKRKQKKQHFILLWNKKLKTSTLFYLRHWQPYSDFVFYYFPTYFTVDQTTGKSADPPKTFGPGTTATAGSSGKQPGFSFGSSTGKIEYLWFHKLY